MLIIVGIWWLQANSLRQAFSERKKDEGNDVQARQEEGEEELSPVVDHWGKSKVKGNNVRTV